MSRLVDKPLVLYGTGKLGKLAKEIFNRLGFFNYMIDKDIPPRMDSIKNYLAVVCIATSPYNEIRSYLEKLGYIDISPFWEIVNAYPSVGIKNGWENDEEPPSVMRKINNMFSDNVSKLHFSSFWRWRSDHWHIKQKEIVPTPSNEFIEMSLPSDLNSIYARMRVEYHMENGWLIFHNEGLELPSLFLHKHLLQKGFRIAVACYHSPDGLTRIPQFLFDNLRGYDFYFRCHAYMGQAAYIYCIPKEQKEA